MAKSELKLVIAVVGAKEAQQQLEDFAKSVKGAGDKATHTSKGFQRLRNATAGLRRRIGSLRNVLLLVTFATAGLTRASRAATEAFRVQAEAEALLRVGLVRTSKQAEFGSQALISYASALQEATQFGDEQIIAQMATLTQYGANEAAIAKLIPRILDLAVGQNGLESVTRAVGMSLKGQTGMMSRLGITLDQFSLASARAAGETEAFNFILSSLSEASKDNQKALNDLRTGELNQLTKKLGDLQEVLGKATVPFDVFRKTALLKTLQVLHRLHTGIEKYGLLWDKLNGRISNKEYLIFTKDLNRRLEEQEKLYEQSGKSAQFKIDGDAKINLTLSDQISLMRLQNEFRTSALALEVTQLTHTKAEIALEENRLKQQEFQNMLRRAFTDDEMKIRKGKEKNISLIIMENKLLAEQRNLQIAVNMEKMQGYALAISGFKELAQAAKADGRLIKTLAIAEATINSYVAYTKALPNVFAAGGALLSGLAQVARIKATKFAAGGAVGGTTIGDQVPAMLQSGEFVLSKDAVRNIGVETAEAINSGASAGVTVNINAPLVDDTVVDSIIPAIQRARRRGLV